MHFSFLKILLLALLFHESWTAAYKSIVDVLSEDTQFETLLSHLQRTKLIPLVNSLEAATFFAPDNDAFSKYSGEEITRDMLLYHILPVGMTGEDFFHGQLLETLFIRSHFLGDGQTGQRVKITKEGNPRKGRGKVLINQAQIIAKDVLVNNQTYIQVIDRVLQPPEIIAKTLKDNAELYPLIEKVKLTDTLSREGPFTVFATRSNPLAGFNTIESDYISSKYGEKDLENLLSYMIVEGAIYSADFPSGKTVYNTITGESLVVAVNKDNVVTVNGIPVVETDVLSANGVIHQLETMPMPKSISFNTRKYLYGLNATKYVSLLDHFGLSHYLDSKDGNHTFLAPLNDAIDENAIPNTLKHGWLSYHILDGFWTSDILENGLLVNSIYTPAQLDHAPQRLPVHVETESTTGKPKEKSIRFDHSRAISDAVSVQNNAIYQLSDPLSLPGDILSSLVVDLDLSTFIATLYVSKVSDQINAAKGITLFVPTNDAFSRLGLVAKYLVHSTASTHLQSVLRFHAATGLLYHADMLNEAHELKTLTNGTLRTSPAKGGKVTVGRPDGSGPVGRIVASNMLVANGVVHKLDSVQIPADVRISNQNILVGIEATSMLELLKRADLLDEIDKNDYIILAPSDRAFAHLDLEALYADPYQLQRVARLHLIPQPYQDTWTQKDNDYPTLLSDKDKVILQESHGELEIRVKDGPDRASAHVIGRGQATAGGGGVLEIDTVLTPVRRGIFGLPWAWAVTLTVTLALLTTAILGLCGFFTYKIWNRRRLGYRTI